MYHAPISQALGIPLAANGTCSDVKKYARDFVLDNVPELAHVYDSIESHNSDRPFCFRHGQACDEASGRDDIMVCGTPCQPFSGYRSGRRAGCGPHRFVSLTLGGADDPSSLASLVTRRQPRCLIFENVASILKIDPVRQESPLMEFVRLLTGIKQTDSSGVTTKPLFAAMHVFEMHPALWLNISRPRWGSLAKVLFRLLFAHARRATRPFTFGPHAMRFFSLAPSPAFF